MFTQEMLCYISSLLGTNHMAAFSANDFTRNPFEAFNTTCPAQ